MCVIVDTNKFAAFCDLADEEANPLRKWVDEAGSIAYSTHSEFAVETTREWEEQIKMHVRRGSVKLVPPDTLSPEIELIKRSGYCRSDDWHILALARVAGARLLYTSDKNLTMDFKNKAIISGPRGKVYSSKNHKSLLRKGICRGC